MGINSRIWNTSEIDEKRKYLSRQEWDRVIKSIDNDLIEIRELFFTKCVDTIKKSNYDIDIVNIHNRGKADIVIKSFQLINILHYLPRYIHPSDGNKFIDMLFHQVCGKYYKKCHDLITCYLELEKTELKKRIYYFSIDIGKYICGYSSDKIPSMFPCLNSYISSGIPKEIMARTEVTISSFLIQSLIPKLMATTIIALALCFDDEEFAREIESKYKSVLD